MKLHTLSKRERRVICCMLVAWVFALSLAVPRYAYAYIDPATTTYIIQIIAAVVITLGLSFSIVLYRFRMLFTQLWVKVTQGSKGKQSPKEESEFDAEREEALAALEARSANYLLESQPSPPQKAYGFAYGDEEKLETLRQAYESKVQTADGPHRDSHKDTYARKKTAQGNANQQSIPYQTGSFKERLALLWSDTRSFKQRLGLAALASAGIVFTLMVFGPLELFATSTNDMLFNLEDFVGTLLLAALIVFIALTLITMLFKGRLFDNILCVLVGLLLACYIQATFFNGIIGQLTGDTIQWQDYRVEVLLNLLLWIGVVAAVFVVRLLSTKVWRAFVVFVPSVLVVVQLVALVSLGGSLFAAPDPVEDNLILTKEGTLELSSQQNIVVFLLDKFDQSYIEDLQAQDPHFFDELEGFTHYTDYLPRYSYTYPSIAHSLTGLENDYVMTSSEYLPQAYSQHLFVDDLVDAGWTSRLYLCGGYDYKSKQLFEGRAANLKTADEVQEEQGTPNDFSVSLTLVEKLNQLSALRYAPLSLKSIFWMSSTDVSEVIINARNEYTSGYQGEFMHDLKTTGLMADDTNPVFMYYHLDGSHRPYYLGADGYKVLEGEPDPLTQTEGCFKIIYEYIAQLKQLGIYDDTCIIILADHGVKGQTLAGLFYKPTTSTDDPLGRSDVPLSDSNLVPTILEEAGVESTAIAAQEASFTEVRGDDSSARKVVQHYRNKKKDYVLSIYEVKGNGAAKENWELLYQEESGLNYWGEQRE